MKSDYGFALLCWLMVLGPTLLVIITGNTWWFLLYVFSALVFGMA